MGKSSNGLDMVAKALGLDLHAKNHLERADENFIQEMATLAPDLAGMPSGTDVPAMRKWVTAVFESEVLIRQRITFRTTHYPQVKIEKQVIKIPCLENAANGIELWVYHPQSKGHSNSQSARPAILMFHGGGWIHGSPIGDEPIAEYFASELNAVVIGVDYRLAPEHKFPAPLDDCEQALSWVCKNAEDLRIDTSRIGLWGASAGGNLCAALSLRDTPIKPRLISLVVPVTAHPRAYDEFRELRSFPRSKTETLFDQDTPIPVAVVQFYTGNETDPCDPYVSPLMAHPSSSHPTTRLTVAACDALRPQGQAYAEVLRQAGVEVNEDILAGVPHGFTFALNANVMTAWLKREVQAFDAAFNVF